MQISIVESPIQGINEDYICITDMAAANSKASRSADIVKNWMRNRSTIEFLGAWEAINNSYFKVVEFDHFRKNAGLPTFVLSPSQWVDKTNAIGLFTKLGRYGGTYAHKDIAFEFGSYLNATFKLFLIKEYQRLKEIEHNQYNFEWNVGRIISSMNYKLQTDAIKDCIIPHSKKPCGIHYASEADLLNVVVWGCTKKDWVSANPKLALSGKNLRDYASINELVVLSRLETLNANMIKNGISLDKRFEYLEKEAREMLQRLNNNEHFIKSIKKRSETTFIKAEKELKKLQNPKENLSSFNKNLKKGKIL